MPVIVEYQAYVVASPHKARQDITDSNPFGPVNGGNQPTHTTVVALHGVVRRCSQTNIESISEQTGIQKRVNQREP